MKKYILIKENIEQSIIKARRKVFGPEQISVIIKTADPSNVTDAIDMIACTIGIKIKEDGQLYGEAIYCSELTEECIIKVIDYLSRIKLTNPLIKGIPITSKSIEDVYKGAVWAN